MGKKQNKITDWLETLQQESWQLELLISGFAIFLLLGAYESIIELGYEVELLQSASFDPRYQLLYSSSYYILLSSWYILIVNLLLHVLLRGLWISTIGLRYVSGDINFRALKFKPKFDRFLRKRVVSFDTYIQQLEKLCSVIFAFTFLIIFLLLSIGLIIGFAVVLVIFIDKVFGGFAGWRLLLILVFIALAGVYSLDFITLGWIKRRKWLSMIYYPIYRFFSMLTLSFIYRPLYYNLVDNAFGRKVVLFLIPYTIVLTFVFSLEIRVHQYLPENRSTQSITNSSYDDTRDDTRPSFTASIPSKFVDNGFIPLFLPYYPRFDDATIGYLCNIAAANTGIFFLGKTDPERNRMNADSALSCHASRFEIYVNDSLITDLRYRFYDHPTRDNIGLLTVLDVDDLPRGEHQIKVSVKFLRYTDGRPVLASRQAAAIPFWIE